MPVFFFFVCYSLARVVQCNDGDDDCLNIIYQAWYLDDSVLAVK